MITTDLSGGLGNQLFQIFATIALAIRQKQSFFFTPTKYTNEVLHELTRTTYWNTLLKNLTKYTFVKQNSYLKSDTFEIKEIDHRFHKMNFKDLNDDHLFILRGYFQTYKYFEDEYQELYKIIGFGPMKDDVISKYNTLTSIMLDDENSISIHFRLGDYKNRIDWHPIMKVEYFKKSLDQIMTTINPNKNVNVFYFCEEEDNNYVYFLIDELRRHFYHSKWNQFDCIFHHVPSNIPDWEQFLLMSICRNNIVANSSFSLMAAHINTNQDKIVCYPDVWFGVRNTSDTTDMFPNNYIKISCDIP
jgi:hypothetical protein